MMTINSTRELKFIMFFNMKKISLAVVPSLLLAAISFLFFFEHNDYSDEEIQWCEEYRPLLPIDTCAREFGY
jgi:hypothetical protein